MSISDELTRIQGAKASLKTSIANKGVEVPDTALIDAYPALVDQIQTGGQTGGDWAVRFVDYDGTIISEMTYTQAQALTSLPELPIHEGLSAIGWNFTLEEVKSIAEPDQLYVGPMYQTTDGINYFYLKMPKTDTQVTLNWSQTVENGVVVDWGDGSATETNSGTGYVTLTHTYTAYSEPTLTMQSVEGNTLTIGANNKPLFDTNQSYLIEAHLANGIELGSYAFQSCTALQSITIPNSVTSIGDYAFCSCYALQSITIPNFVTSIGSYAFYSCYALQSITIPNFVTSIGSSAFQGCYALQSIIIPNSVTSIGYGAFQNCTALQSITIPNFVTSIGSYAFYNCCNITIDLTAATEVPSLSGDLFGDTANHPTILVPSALLSDFQSATNWSTYAGFMKGV